MAHLGSIGSPVLLFALPLVLLSSCNGPEDGDLSILKLEPVPARDITIDDHFWNPHLAMIENKAIPYQAERLEELGRIENFRRAAAGSGEHQGPWLGDAHVYEWIEAASRVIERKPDAPIRARVQKIVEAVAAAQQPDGYLNTFFQLKHPDERWANLGMGCELYCAGHLIRAALAHYRATSEKTLLDPAVKFADLICRTFGEDGRRGAPGYPGIEAALADLYRLTKERRYLDTAEFFIRDRGRKPFIFEGEPALDGVPAREHGPEFFLAHKPFEKQIHVTGHAARALRLYEGAAAVYGETGDPALGKALDKLWQSALDPHVHITGGLASSCGIAGSEEGDYTEIGALAAAVRWSQRMLRIKGEFAYGDVTEQTVYNGILGCISRDGERFFPRMVLSSKGDVNRTNDLDGAACPSEAAGILSSLDRYLYSTSEKGIWIHMYVSGTVKTRFADLEVDSQFPWIGIVRIMVRPKTKEPFSIFVRKPNFCGEAQTRVKQKEEMIFPRYGGGYAELHHTWEVNDDIGLFLDIPLKERKAVTLQGKKENRVALQKSSLLYCAEEMDNPAAGSDLDRFVLNRILRIKEDYYPDLLGGVKKMKLWATYPNGEGGWDNRFLYVVPYFAWNNRGAGNMRLWIKQQ